MIGDVVKTLGVNGSSIVLSGGIVQSTTGKMTAVLYSLFASDWVGNMFVTGDSILQSDFQLLHTATVTLDTLVDIADSAMASLDWLVKSGDVKSIAAATRVVEGGTFITEIDFEELDGTVNRIEVWKHPHYWEVRGEI